MTLEQLQELNSRRKMLIDNIDFFKSNHYRLQSRMQEMQERIDESEAMLESITNIFFELSSTTQPKVTPFNCTGPNGKPNIMLKIEIEGQEPIYKCLHELDYSFYGDNETLNGQLLLRNRFNEIALDFIREQFHKGSLARSFEKEAIDFHLSPERYIKCTLSRKKLESRRQ
jgi:hypothetical protein